MITTINKPKGLTSFAVIAKIRKLTGIKKVGHAGTLDPLASGILVIGIGQDTKQLAKLINLDKEYQARIRLGAMSKTDDAEGPIAISAIRHIPTRLEIEETLSRFVGNLRQVPPQFSAIKRKGLRAYDWARKGKPVNLGWREISIYQIQILKYKWPNLDLKIKCSSGTYIRALARDIGNSLKVGGYLEELCRTQVGDYKLDQAVRLEDFRMDKTD